MSFWYSKSHFEWENFAILFQICRELYEKEAVFSNVKWSPPRQYSLQNLVRQMKDKCLCLILFDFFRTNKLGTFNHNSLVYKFQLCSFVHIKPHCFLVIVNFRASENYKIMWNGVILCGYYTFNYPDKLNGR